jgi:hypothetical protein
MSLVRNGYAVSGGGFLGALFSALLALAVFGPSMASAQEVKQIRLTEKHMPGGCILVGVLWRKHGVP